MIGLSWILSHFFYFVFSKINGPFACQSGFCAVHAKRARSHTVAPYWRVGRKLLCARMSTTHRHHLKLFFRRWYFILIKKKNGK